MHSIQKQILKLAHAEDISQYGLRKLGEKIGVDHPQQVKWHLNKLLNDGRLTRTISGSIKVQKDLAGAASLARIPILGLANCGEPLSFADSTTHGYLSLSTSLIKSKRLNSLFAVRATGDSMNKCHVDGKNIDDGDYVVVDASVEVPQTGDYVVSSIEGLANIKRYIRDEEQQVIALVSESTKPRPPIMIDPTDTGNYIVHGKVVQVIKTPSL